MGISEISRSGAIKGSWPKTVEREFQLVYLQFASIWEEMAGLNGLTPGIISDEGFHIKRRHFDVVKRMYRRSLEDKK